MIIEDYKNREQAFIKHTLLRGYLERLFMIIGQRERVVCYVDCFAGPWQGSNKFLDDTSIAISLNIIKKCRVGLLDRGRDVKFRALYLEKDVSAYTKLQSYLSETNYPGIEIKAINGDFNTKIDEILEWCGYNNFSFFFIDPTGWKEIVEPSILMPLLRKPNSEYLINFMYTFLVRAHSQEIHKSKMMDIFGKVPVTDGMTPKDREKYLIDLYCKNIKNALVSTRLKARAAHVRVLYPCMDKTIYDLIYFTRHPLGICVFMEESERINLIQRKVRAQAKQDSQERKTKQRQLFTTQINIDEKDSDFDLNHVKEYWLTKLSNEPKQFGIEEFADMLEETGWFVSDFQEAFIELQKDGKVKNLNASRNRPKHAIHFKDNNGEGEFLERIKL